MMRGVDTLTSTPQASVNSHSLLGWLTRPTVRGTAELGLGQQRRDEVGLVVAGRRDHHVALVETGLLEGRQLAGVGQQPLGVGHPVGLDGDAGPCRSAGPGVLVWISSRGDGAPDGAGLGDGDAHGLILLRGRWLKTR